MIIYILRFVPYSSGIPIDAAFTDEGRAEAAYVKATDSALIDHTAKDFTDDFGIQFSINTEECAVILTNTLAGAAMDANLAAANRDASTNAGKYVVGSSGK